MSLVCVTITNWVTQTILTPVDSWASQQENKCQQYPWWDPRGWFCYVVTVWIRITVWVMKNVVLPIAETICSADTAFLGFVLLPFIVALDAACDRCNILTWWKRWFLNDPGIVFVSQTPSASGPGYDYTFICNCNPWKKPTIIVEADNDAEAAEKAKAKCESECA